MNENMRDKIKNALTADEFLIFEKLISDSTEMYILLNDRVNRDTSEEILAIKGNQPFDVSKLIDESEWSERAYKVLSNDEP